jgi:hypothetical protein
METRFSALVLGLMLIVNLATANIDHERIVGDALDRITWNFETAWAFNETAVDDTVTTIGRFDPSKDEGSQWQLLSYDNRPPSPEEQENYARSKAFSHLDMQSDDGDGLASMIRFETLELVDEGASYWEYSFRPEFGADEEEAQFLDSLHGSLRVSKLTGNVLSIDIRNLKTIRPIVGAKIKRLTIRFEFGETVIEGPWVLTKLEVHVQGSAFVVVRFNELERYEFSDFEFVGES